MWKDGYLLLAGVILTHCWPWRSEFFRNNYICQTFTGLDYCFTNFKTFSRIQGSVQTLPPPLCLINTKTKKLDCFPYNFNQFTLVQKELNARYIQYIGLALHHGLSPKQKRRYFSFQLKIIIHNESANNTLATLCLKETSLNNYISRRRRLSSCLLCLGF